MGVLEMLTQQQGMLLVQLARLALLAKIAGEKPALPEIDPRIEEKGATFVTLTLDGALRGCIGTPDARVSLADDVRQNAVRAATADPRFHPVTPAELSQIHIEVSVLTPPRLLECAPSERAERVMGLGLLLTSGFYRGLLLPQVWERISDPQEFLAILCQKAGLPPTAWQEADVSLYTFQVQAFHE